MIPLLSGVKLGAQLACPQLVICFGFDPSASATQTSILVGATNPSFNNSLYSFTSVSDFGLLARQTIFFPSGLNHAPPSYPNAVVICFSFPVAKSIIYNSKSPLLSLQ